MRSPRSAARALDRAVRLLHLVAGVSYFKAAVPPRIQVGGPPPGATTARFLGRLYTQGLGEFAWRNDLPRIGAGIVFPAGEEAQGPAPAAGLAARSLVPIGGGKDSVVTLAALTAAGEELVGFSVGRKPSSEAAARIEGAPLLHVERAIDPALFALNSAGAYNGHVPITAIVSCAALVAALLHDCDAVVMSNERSASSGNFDWPEFGAVDQPPVQQELGGRARPGRGGGARRRPRPALLLAAAPVLGARHQPGLRAPRAPPRHLHELQRRLPIHEPSASGLVRRLPQVPVRLPRPGARSSAGTRCGGSSAPTCSTTRPRRPGFRAILGIDAEKPFECVGETDEARAALRAVAASPEWAGDAVVARLAPRVGGPDADAVAPWLARAGDHAIPPRHDRIIGAFLGA